MTIIADYRNHKIEILDVWESGNVKFASVKALEGRPFVGGDKWPVRTEYTTARIDELSNITPDPQPEPKRQPNLLEMALAYQDKKQWYSGESVRLISDPNNRPVAWLKNNYDRIWLMVKGVNHGLVVYLLTENGWELVPTIQADYHRWASKAQATRTR